MPRLRLPLRYALIGALLAPLALAACEDEAPTGETGEAHEDTGQAVEDAGGEAQ